MPVINSFYTFLKIDLENILLRKNQRRVAIRHLALPEPQNKSNKRNAETFAMMVLALLEKKAVIRFQIRTLWISVANDSVFLKLDFVVYPFREFFFNKNLLNNLYPVAFLATSIHPRLQCIHWERPAQVVVEMKARIVVHIGLFSLSNSKKTTRKVQKKNFWNFLSN